MWTIFEVFNEFITLFLLFCVLVFWPWGMWDLISPTRDRTCTPCIGRRSPIHWTAREVPVNVFWMKEWIRRKKGKVRISVWSWGEKEGQEMKEGAESGVEEASAWNMLECPGKWGFVPRAIQGHEGPDLGPVCPPPPPLLSFRTTAPNSSAKTAPVSPGILGDTVHGTQRGEVFTARLQEPLFHVTWYPIYFPGRIQGMRDIPLLEKQAYWFLWISCH